MIANHKLHMINDVYKSKLFQSIKLLFYKYKFANKKPNNKMFNVHIKIIYLNIFI
jgi:hypothetical protein